MKQLAALLVLIVLLPVLASFSEKPAKTKLHAVPEQTFDPWAELGLSWHDTITVDSFSVSAFITLGEYRQYLASVKKDSGYAYYVTQLPDSQMCAPEAYAKYMNTPAYDAYPVSGVSWVNALNYCRWRTKKEQIDTLGLGYRLPYIAEWLAAYRHFGAKKIANDLNQDYSDWVMEAHDESAYHFQANNQVSWRFYSNTWIDNPSDPKVMRRKKIMGNSFHFQHEKPGDCLSHYEYSFTGRAYVSFRVVRATYDPRLRQQRKRMYKPTK